MVIWFDVSALLYSSLSSPAGWLLDITKLQLGENIGEGEFGGELPVIEFPCYELFFAPSPTFIMQISLQAVTGKNNSVPANSDVVLHLSCL